MAKTYNNLYSRIIKLDNLSRAFVKARKGKTKKNYVIEFERDLEKNLSDLHDELKNETYLPKPLKTFILRIRIISNICNSLNPFLRSISERILLWRYLNLLWSI